MLHGREVIAEPLVKRRELIEKYVLPKLADPIRYSPVLEASLPDLIRSVKAQGLEGLVAKRRDSKYEPGLRSGAWQKMRVNQRQEFVIAGYTPSLRNFDALVIGYFEGDRLIYARQNPRWLHALIESGVVQEDQTIGNQGVPLCEFTREKGRAVGRRSDGRKNGGMSVAQAAARGALRVRRMDV